MASRLQKKIIARLQKKIIERVVRTEGGFTNNPDDSGGPTKFGITEYVANKAGYSGDMDYFPIETAFAIYSKNYWHAVKADELAELSEAIAEEVVDTGVNCGVGTAQMFLQRALNAFNNKAKLYADVSVDGHIGDRTLEALKSYLEQRDEIVMLRALNCLQGARYFYLVEMYEKNETFFYGWMKHRIKTF